MFLVFRTKLIKNQTTHILQQTTIKEWQTNLETYLNKKNWKS